MVQDGCSNRRSFADAPSHGGQSENGALAYIDARGNRSSGTNPCIGLDCHLVRKEREVRIVVIVRCTAKVSTLRQDGVRSNAYWRRIVDFGMVGSGDVVCAG